jgi:hypothetical protein
MGKGFLAELSKKERKRRVGEIEQQKERERQQGTGEENFSLH